MTTEDLLQLDYRKEENQKIIQKALRKIFPDEPKIGIVPLETLELYVAKIERKNSFCISYITPIQTSAKDMYTARIIDRYTLKHIKSIHGLFLYELFAKLCIYFYYMVKKGGR